MVIRDARSAINQEISRRSIWLRLLFRASVCIDDSMMMVVMVVMSAAAPLLHPAG